MSEQSDSLGSLLHPWCSRHAGSQSGTLELLSDICHVASSVWPIFLHSRRHFCTMQQLSYVTHSETNTTHSVRQKVFGYMNKKILQKSTTPGRLLWNKSTAALSTPLKKMTSIPKIQNTIYVTKHTVFTPVLIQLTFCSFNWNVSISTLKLRRELIVSTLANSLLATLKLDSKSVPYIPILPVKLS